MAGILLTHLPPLSVLIRLTIKRLRAISNANVRIRELHSGVTRRVRLKEGQNQVCGRWVPQGQSSDAGMGQVTIAHKYMMKPYLTYRAVLCLVTLTDL